MVGRYGALAGILNSFEVAPAPGAEPLPDVRASGGRANVLQPKTTPRLTPISDPNSVVAADRGVFDAVAEGRGSVRGPFAILMYSPPLCQRIFDVSNYLRFESSLSPVCASSRPLRLPVKRTALMFGQLTPRLLDARELLMTR